MDEYLLDAVVHTDSPALGRRKQEDFEFKGSLSFRRSSLKTLKKQQQKER